MKLEIKYAVEPNMTSSNISCISLVATYGESLFIYTFRHAMIKSDTIMYKFLVHSQIVCDNST